MSFSRDEIENELNLEGNIDALYELVVETLGGQPYNVACRECGKKLDFDATVDSDNDIMVDVERCDCED